MIFLPRYRLVKLIIFSLIIPSWLFAQYTNHKKSLRGKFSFEKSEGEEVIRTWHHYVVTTLPNGHFVLRKFYPETGRLTSLETALDDRFHVLRGPAKYWYDRGSIWSEGVYEDGRKNGVWKEYAREGSFQIGEYKNGDRFGKWKVFDRDQRPVYECLYNQDSLCVFVLDFDQKILRRIDYVDSTSQSLSFLGSTNDYEQFPDEPPTLKYCEHLEQSQRGHCSDSTLLNYMQRYMIYPRKARKQRISGTAYFQFVIEKDGHISNVRTISGLCVDIERECRRIISALPRWTPAKKDGQPVRTVFIQPFGFRMPKF